MTEEQVLDLLQGLINLQRKYPDGDYGSAAVQVYWNYLVSLNMPEHLLLNYIDAFRQVWLELTETQPQSHSLGAKP